GSRSVPEVADERDRDDIRVAGDEVRGPRREREVAIVRAERDAGGRARIVALVAGLAEARERRRPGPDVAQEDVGDLVRVASDQVRGQRRERDVATVRADARGAEALLVGLRTGAADAHKRRAAGVPIVREDVEDAVRVATDEVRVARVKDDIASARADRRRVAAGVGPVAAALPAAAVDAHARRPAGAPIADEDVAEPIHVVWDEVRRRRLEGDVAAVRAQGRLGAFAEAEVATRLAAAAIDADARRLS